MEEREMKSAEIDINIKGDTANLSKMQIVFDPLKPTEVFNGIKQAVHDLEVAFKQSGILTKQGIGVGEMKDYIEYMKSIVDETEKSIYKLYHMKAEITSSELEYKFILEDMIEEMIQESQKIVDDYYDMFDEVKVIEATEWDINRPQTIVEDVEDTKDIIATGSVEVRWEEEDAKD